MTFDSRTYHREWMRRKRQQMREEMADILIERARAREERRVAKLILEGKCPVCEMLLISTFHIRCKYLDDLHTPH